MLIENIKPDDDNLLPGQMFINFTQKYDLKDFFEKKIDGEQYYVLKLVTRKGEEKFISKITAYVNDDFVTTRLEYEDMDNNKTSLVLSNIVFDRELPADKFTFQNSTKAEVVDLRKK